MRNLNWTTHGFQSGLGKRDFPSLALVPGPEDSAIDVDDDQAAPDANEYRDHLHAIAGTALTAIS
jgi:hypothetical protein